MRRFKYKAIDIQGQVIKGIYEGISSKDLKTFVHQQRLLLISYSWDFSQVLSKKVSQRELIDLCVFLEHFELSGISLRDGLEELLKGSFSLKLKKILKNVQEEVEGGCLLSRALEKHKDTFSPVFIGLISVGEKTGRLAFTLNHLHTHLKWVEMIQYQTIKSLRYPFILVLVLFILIIILMTTLVPEVTLFLNISSVSLPLSTQILMFISRFLTDHFFLLLSILFFLSTLILAFIKFNPSGVLWKDTLLNSIPLLGPLRKKMELSRFSHLLSILYVSGIDIWEALKISRSSMKSGQVTFAIEKLERYVCEGCSLSQSFEKAGFFPNIIIRMIRIGESTSRLDKSLLQMNDYLETTIKKEVDTLIGYIEPVVIVCLGLFMTWIILSVFLPLYESLSQMDL